jgi:hypothetical protein
MNPVDVGLVTEIAIVVVGLFFTLLIFGALLYWIDQQWLRLDARQRRERDDARPPESPDQADESSRGRPPTS